MTDEPGSWQSQSGSSRGRGLGLELGAGFGFLATMQRPQVRGACCYRRPPGWMCQAAAAMRDARWRQWRMPSTPSVLTHTSTHSNRQSQKALGAQDHAREPRDCMVLDFDRATEPRGPSSPSALRPISLRPLTSIEEGPSPSSPWYRKADDKCTVLDPGRGRSTASRAPMPLPTAPPLLFARLASRPFAAAAFAFASLPRPCPPSAFERRGLASPLPPPLPHDSPLPHDCRRENSRVHPTSTDSRGHCGSWSVAVPQRLLRGTCETPGTSKAMRLTAEAMRSD
jgi:hypothetical protein